MISKPTTEIERLVAVETKIDTVIDQQKDLLTELKSMNVAYVPRVELNEWRKTSEEEHKSIRQDVEAFKKEVNGRLKVYRQVAFALFTTSLALVATAFGKLIFKI